MTISYNIAFGKAPLPGFMSMLREVLKKDGVPLLGAVLTTAPVAYNLGLMFSDSFADHERFVTQLTMVLMPAKYGRCDGDSELVEGLFTDQVNP